MKTLIILLVTVGIFHSVNSQQFIADYSTAKESVLRSIPEEYINKARTELKIAYQHTSHGTHVSRGLFGLQDYKDGDSGLFGITENNTTSNKLEFHDYAIGTYHAPGEDASDLSRNETAFIKATRNYLDDPANANINVIMWSWCNIAGHDVEGNYLPGMQILIDEYGEGGSKIGTNSGQRENAVHFIFMTGHANSNNNIGDGNPKNQADLITNYCTEHEYYCLDYYSIDTHDMNDNYWDDAGDNGNSSSYGGNFYQDFQDSHSLGNGYFYNKISPGGNVAAGSHNTQHITANRKAYAMWWILARIAGWQGITTDKEVSLSSTNQSFYYNQDTKNIVLKNNNYATNNTICSVHDLTGRTILNQNVNGNKLSLESLKRGIYIITIESVMQKNNFKIVIN